MVATGLAVECALIPLALYPFPPVGALRRRRQHHRHPADHLRDHAARSGRAAARRGRAGASRCGCCAARRSTSCSGWRTAVASANGAVAMLPSMPGWAFALMVARRAVAVPVDDGAGALLGLVPFAVGAAGAALRPRRTCWSPATDGISRSSIGRRAADPARPRRRLCPRSARRSVGLRRRPGRRSAAQPFSACSLRCLRRG